MIIIKVQGGLGNQMFSYALALKMQHLGRNVKLDTSLYSGAEKRALSELAGKFDIASIDEIHKLQEYKTDIFSSIRRNIGFRKKTHIREEDSYMPEIFNMETAYLDGYWQKEDYFVNIRDSILNFFDNNIKQINAYEENIKSTNAVCVHVRRGDYLEFSDIYGNICTIDYYKKALDFILKRVEKPTFFFFSDDMKWVKENLAVNNAVYVDTKGDKPENDIYLMSKCKHNIIANSSFSWWGAWLNAHTNKIVVAPSRWNNISNESPVCDGWTKI